MRSTYMPTKYKTLIPYHTIGILLRFTYTMLGLGCDRTRSPVAGPMRGLGLKEMARCTLY